ncbi:MAG: diacylglycerol kinase family protein [Thiobacillaceae bacterium]|jgi:diacylglycerol kinase|nr:diacylglycerol kinase family protein [Thiobacillaceae bacterium]
MHKSFASIPRSFVYALQGLVFMLRSQPNAWVHLLATLGVCGAGFYVGLSRGEWLWICMAVVLVWSAEAFNTALEQMADAVHPQRHPGIGRAKDLAAGAVLVAAIGAAVIGGVVFWPHLAGMSAS